MQQLKRTSSGYFDIGCRRIRRRHRLATRAKSFEMKTDGVAHHLLDSRAGWRGSDTPRHVGRISRIACIGSLDKDQIALHGGHSSVRRFRPACFMMLFKVAGDRSSLLEPATVTRPGLPGCLNWRWLPRVRVSDHPSLSSNRSISRIFNACSETCLIGRAGGALHYGCVTPIVVIIPALTEPLTRALS